MGKKRPYHHGNLRQALIDAALELIEERGVPALTLREVARQVGVTHAAPQRHFADRAALVAAVAEQGFRGLAAHVAAVRGPPRTPAPPPPAPRGPDVGDALAHSPPPRGMFSPQGADKARPP